MLPSMLIKIRQRSMLISSTCKSWRHLMRQHRRPLMMHASNWNQISRRLRKRAKRLLMRPIRSLRLWITVVTLLTKTLRIVSKRWRMLSRLRGQLLSMKLFQSCKTPMTPLYQLTLLTLTVWRRQSKRLTMLWMQRHTTQRRQHKRSQITRRLLQRRRMP